MTQVAFSFSIWIAIVAMLHDVVSAIEEPIMIHRKKPDRIFGESVHSILLANKVSTMNKAYESEEKRVKIDWIYVDFKNYMVSNPDSGGVRHTESTAIAIHRNRPYKHHQISSREGVLSVLSTSKLTSMSKANEFEPKPLKIDWNKMDYETQSMFSRNGNGGRQAEESTVCDFEKQAYVNCIPSLECAECLDGAFEDARNQMDDTSTCWDLTVGLCAVARSCSCGCEGEAETFYNCLVENATEGSCIVDCELVNNPPRENPRLNDTAPDCATETNIAVECLLPGNPNCISCISGSFDNLIANSDSDFVSCNDVYSTLCTAIHEGCDCGPCTVGVEALYDCVLLGSECLGLECLDDSPPPSTPPDYTAPDCAAEIKVADDCLEIVNPSCPSCVDDTVEDLFAGNDTTVSCDTLVSEACNAIYDTCGCGSCTSEVEAAYNCLYSSTDCFGIDCPMYSPPPTSPTVDGEVCYEVIDDPCIFDLDLECDAGTLCAAGTDCFDCDPLKQYNNAGCSVCISKGGYYCEFANGQGVCSDPFLTFLVPFFCGFNDGGTFWQAVCGEATKPPVDQTPLPTNPPKPDPCKTEKQAFVDCIPSIACAQCLDSAFEDALDLDDGATCRDLEDGVCLVAPSCSCGCEAEAEAFYKCVIEDVTENCSLNCNPDPTECETEINIAAACLQTVNPLCPSCVNDSLENLFVISDSVPCETFNSKACMAIYDRCDCGSCAAEVEAMYSCMFLDTTCLGLDCDMYPIETPLNPPTLLPVDSEVTRHPGGTQPTPGPEENIIQVVGPNGPDLSRAFTASCYMMLITGLFVEVTFLW